MMEYIIPIPSKKRNAFSFLVAPPIPLIKYIDVPCSSLSLMFQTSHGADSDRSRGACKWM